MYSQTSSCFTRIMHIIAWPLSCLVFTLSLTSLVYPKRLESTRTGVSIHCTYWQSTRAVVESPITLLCDMATKGLILRMPTTFRFRFRFRCSHFLIFHLPDVDYFRGHFQTTFADLNVIMTLGGGGVWGCDVITDHKG